MFNRALLAALLFPALAAAGTLDIGVEKLKGERGYTTLTFDKAFGSVELYGYADTTSYGEVFVGRSFEQGKFTIVPYIGIDTMTGKGVKARGAAWFGYEHSEKLSAEVLFEFGGAGGQFRKLQLHLKEGDLKYTLLHRSDVGAGLRVAYTKWTWSPYVQVTKGAVTFGLSTPL